MLRCGGARDLPAVGLTASNPYDPIAMITDMRGGGVTFWKTILSLFLLVGANDFEGVRRRMRLGIGWK